MTYLFKEDKPNKNSKPVSPISKKVDATPKLSWAEIFARLSSVDVPDDFLSPEQRNQGVPREIDHLFDDWVDDPPD